MRSEAVQDSFQGFYGSFCALHIYTQGDSVIWFHRGQEYSPSKLLYKLPERFLKFLKWFWLIEAR